MSTITIPKNMLSSLPRLNGEKIVARIRMGSHLNKECKNYGTKYGNRHLNRDIDPDLFRSDPILYKELVTYKFHHKL